MSRIKTYIETAGWPLFLLGVLFLVIGASLIAGGLTLAVYGGSLYYLVAGIAMLVSGILLCMGRVAGAWVYLVLFGLTVVWAIWEVGFDGWALVPRVFAPFLLSIGVIAGLPRLVPDKGHRLRLWGFGALALLGIALTIVVAITSRSRVLQPVPDAQSNLAFASSNLPSNKSEWSTYGGGPGAQRYSDLNQITPQNVGKLEKAWTYHTGEAPKKYGPETTPLKIGDTVFGCNGMNKLYALDARSGKERWHYDPKVAEKNIPYTAACRGVAYFVTPHAPANAACPARIIEGTLDGRLIAVDALTGKPCAGFGEGGQVRITEGMGTVIPGMVAITAPPVVVRGIIVTGHQVQDGQYRFAPSGVIQGFDAVTGKRVFAWDMMRPEIKNAPPAGQTFTRGTPNMWTAATGDEGLGLVYLPMGNSGADYYSSTRRPEENAHSSALVALDVTTGKPRWTFQTVKHDVWDYDLGSQVSLIDYPTRNGPVPALVLPSKTGDIYVLDRRTGASLGALGQYKTPTGGVEPTQRVAFQPISLFNSLRKPDLKEKDMWGMSPIDQMICRIQFRSASYKGYMTPPTADQRYIQYPGYNGGSDWGSVAIDPRRGVIIANYNDMPNYNKLIPRAIANKRGIYPLGSPQGEAKHKGEDLGAQQGVPYAIEVNAGWRMPLTGMLCKQPPYGGMRAIDLATGKTLWDRPFGTARRNGPFGIPSLLPFDIGTPNNGGAAITGSGLIFIAAATDNLIRAIDIRTGKTVWSDTLPAGGQATPMIYEQDGREFVVIMAGGHHFMETPQGDALIAYALPR